jgi:hypothetical protein
LIDVQFAQEQGAPSPAKRIDVGSHKPFSIGCGEA